MQTALRLAILGMDTRTGGENDWLIERFWPVPTWPENWRSLVPPRGTFNYDMKAAYNVPITRTND